MHKDKEFRYFLNQVINTSLFHLFLENEKEIFFGKKIEGCSNQHNLTTNKYPEVYNALLELVSNNDKDGFILLANQFKDLFPERYDTIQEKINYILNNWKERQVYLNKPYLKCSMESHISHIFADLFTSRPKSYSKKGLEKLLQIRLLKVNGYNLKEIYFKSLNNLTEIKENIIKDHVKLSNLNYHTNESVHDYEYKIDSSIYYPYENNIVKYI